MRRLLSVVACMVVTVAGSALPASAPAETGGVGLLKQRVEFTVKNPAENGATHQIVGYRYDTFCTSPTAVVLMHGLSYTKESWDFPGYSYAQKLAEAGYAVFAVDRLGYGESKLANGYNVTHEAYADMAHQIVDQLRSQGFSHVVLGGHSAGAGKTQLQARPYGGGGPHHCPGLRPPRRRPPATSERTPATRSCRPRTAASAPTRWSSGSNRARSPRPAGSGCGIPRLSA